MMLDMKYDKDSGFQSRESLADKKGIGKSLNGKLPETDEASSAFTQSGRESSDRFKC